jgi:hypothetical protein
MHPVVIAVYLRSSIATVALVVRPMSVIERFSITPSWKDDGQTLPYRLGKVCRPSENKSNGARILGHQCEREQ